jgi:hypothetical protein
MKERSSNSRLAARILFMEAFLVRKGYIGADPARPCRMAGCRRYSSNLKSGRPPRAARLKAEQLTSSVSWVVESERRHRSVAEGKRFRLQVKLASPSKTELRHGCVVVESAEKGLARSRRHNRIPTGLDFTIDGLLRNAEPGELHGERVWEIARQVGDVAAGHEHRDARLLADEHDEAPLCDTERLGVPVAENSGRRQRVRDGRTQASEELRVARITSTLAAPFPARPHVWRVT